YTPTFAARLAASYAGADTTETITITATDGTTTSNPLSITATIAQYAPHTVMTTVPVGANPVGVAISPDGRTAYTANYGDNTVSVIDLVTNTVRATIPVGVNPYEVVVSPDGGTVYVVNNQAGSVSVIDSVTNTVTATITDVAGRPRTIAIAPDGKRLYVAGTAAKGLSVIDTDTNSVIKKIVLNHTPDDLAVSRDGKTIYVAGTSSGLGPVTLIDTATYSQIDEINVGYPIRRIAVSPDDKTLYATVWSSSLNGLAIIDVAAGAVTDTINFGIVSTQPTLSPDATIAYITHAADGAVSVVDTATGAVITTIPIGTDTHPASMAFSPNGDLAYVVSNPTDGRVAVVWTGLASHKAAPTVSVVAGHPEATTGAVTLTVTTADADGDHVTVTAAPSIGTVVDNGDGTFTYTLSFAERIQASGAAPETVTFTATDAHGLSSTTTVSVEMGFAPNTLVGQIDPGAGYNSRNVVITADGRTAYSTSVNANKVIVVDLASRTVTGSIDVPASPRGLALSPDEKTLWVTAAFGRAIVVIDTESKTVAHTLPVAGFNPNTVVLTPDGDFALVGDSGRTTPQATLYIVDTSTHEVVANLDYWNTYADLTMAPNGKFAYGVSNTPNSVVLIDIENRNLGLIASPATSQAREVAVSSDSKTLYISYFRSNDSQIAVVDAATATVSRTISLPEAGVSAIVLSTDGTTLYAANLLTNLVSVVDIAEGTVTKTIAFDTPSSLAISADGDTVIVSSFNHSRIGVIATGAN
ncbi:beta-propeller fold lactonase family protein, partial [Mycolicibacterium sp. P9-22]|uniref:beta-propeller fold lactonase family protein n=1 Tax=Mycolicibacterium sp. P9-22 TaxID=2024613 RepID=UPI0011EBBC80